MLGSKLFVCNLLVWLATSSKLLIRAEGRWSNAQIGLNETKDLNIIPGIECFLANDVIVVNVKMRDLLRETEVQEVGRSRQQKNNNPLQRFGYMMLMTPLVMQVLSLPGTIASIKTSLLKSIMVAQLAIAIMLYNLLRNAQNSEVVVIHQPQHHSHYYHDYHHRHSADDEDEWFGR